MKNIKKQFIDYNKTSRSFMPNYIVIHDTGDSGATAQNEHDYFAGGNRNASADFFVDREDIIQIIDTDNFYSWHCGDGGGKYGITNGNSLGVEMCLEADGKPSENTINNTLDLVRYLRNKYDIDINYVVRHYDASRKICPGSFSDNNWARWYDFKDKLCSFTVRGEWLLENNKWWYKHEDGSYTKAGFEKINGRWYYFDDEGVMQTGWIKDKDKDYCFYSDGSMIHDCRLYGYSFDSNGVAFKLE